ncbi:MAG TPA: enoyl-CoA hydratase/isomerase family protein, partial [Acidimicrobiales bacterium]|nr:enoyl-CoA hydratase/isomerase family protein [Acidimicrobiales bacterium]
MTYEELVTRAKLRWITLPGVAGDVALITLDNGKDHTKPNTFGQGGLDSLDTTLDEVFARPDLAAVCVTGKPFVFSVGADLTGMPVIEDREQALALGRVGHRVFRRLHDSTVPTFALVNGAAMGGGLEIALHCHYRTVSTTAAPIALPECFLGLLPGWGGTQLLPRIVGPERALQVIVENPLAQNRMLKGPEAFSLGVADAIFEPADFLERSLLWAASVLRGETVVTRPEPPDAEAWSAAVARVRAGVEARLHGAAPAPYRALDLVELARTASVDEGFAAEDEALADLALSGE